MTRTSATSTLDHHTPDSNETTKNAEHRTALALRTLNELVLHAAAARDLKMGFRV